MCGSVEPEHGIDPRSIPCSAFSLPFLLEEPSVDRSDVSIVYCDRAGHIVGTIERRLYDDMIASVQVRCCGDAG